MLIVVAGRPRKSQQSVAANPREEIVAAATHLFASRGIAATTMAEIAESAGLGPSSLYYWFRSKQQILEVIVEDVNRAPLAYAERVASEEGPVPERLRRLIAYDVEALCALPFDINEVHRLATDETELARYWEDRRRLIAAVERLVAEGVRRGELREVDPRLTALTLLANDEASQNWFRARDTAYTPAEIGAFLAELAVRSLTP